MRAGPGPWRPRWWPILAFGVVLVLAVEGRGQPAAGRFLDDLFPDQSPEVALRALRALETRRERAAVPALIELLRFELPVPVELVVGVLEDLSGQRFGRDWRRWVEWLQKRPDLAPPPEFVPWKGRLYGLVDPAFADWFRPGIPHRLRMEEIVWGGVLKDGIPALTNPAHVAASQATYLTDDELVFGVALNGESRAYPLRIMDWHEMANDVVGGVPVALAY
jgi:hypothetical protein